VVFQLNALKEELETSKPPSRFKTTQEEGFAQAVDLAVHSYKSDYSDSKTP
jgi:hypothetical protein